MKVRTWRWSIVCYLGITLNFSGRFLLSQKTLTAQGRKALGSVLSRIRHCQFNAVTKLSIFDTYVSGILNYGSEVWGFHPANDIEKVHMNFLRSIVCVRKSVCKQVLYFEVGRLPLSIIRKFIIMKYWCKLLTTENTVLRACYVDMLLDTGLQGAGRLDRNWARCVKRELYRLGLAEHWDGQYIENTAAFMEIFKRRYMDEYIQQCRAFFEVSNKCVVYRHISDTFDMQTYLTVRLTPQQRACLFKFLTSTNDLEVERGRYANTPRNLRLCVTCDRHELEDEYHFVLCCPFYYDLRTKYIKKYYHHRPSMFKLVELFKSTKTKTLRHLSIFLQKAIIRRNHAMT